MKRLFELVCSFVAGTQAALAFLAYTQKEDWRMYALVAACAVVAGVANALRTPR